MIINKINNYGFVALNQKNGANLSSNKNYRLQAGMTDSVSFKGGENYDLKTFHSTYPLDYAEFMTLKESNNLDFNNPTTEQMNGTLRKHFEGIYKFIQNDNPILGLGEKAGMHNALRKLALGINELEEGLQASEQGYMVLQRTKELLDKHKVVSNVIDDVLRNEFETTFYKINPKNYDLLYKNSNNFAQEAVDDLFKELEEIDNTNVVIMKEGRDPEMVLDATKKVARGGFFKEIQEFVKKAPVLNNMPLANGGFGQILKEKRDGGVIFGLASELQKMFKEEKNQSAGKFLTSLLENKEISAVAKTIIRSA